MVGFLKVCKRCSDLQVGVDVPGPSLDMMLRFMDVDFSLVPGSAESASRLGGVDRFGVHYGEQYAAKEETTVTAKTDWAG
jgi:carboxypeptidase D